MNLAMRMAFLSGMLAASVQPPALQPRVCAIPLINVLPKAGRYRIATVPVPPAAARSRPEEVKVPAPACRAVRRPR